MAEQILRFDSNTSVHKLDLNLSRNYRSTKIHFSGKSINELHSALKKSYIYYSYRIGLGVGGINGRKRFLPAFVYAPHLEETIEWVKEFRFPADAFDARIALTPQIERLDPQVPKGGIIYFEIFLDDQT